MPAQSPPIPAPITATEGLCVIASSQKVSIGLWADVGSERGFVATANVERRALKAGAMSGSWPIALIVAALFAFYAVIVGARRLEPVLARGPMGPRIAKYLLLVVRSWTFGAFVLAAMW